MLTQVSCPQCSGIMLPRRRKKNQLQFFGCSNFPACRQTMTAREYELQGYLEIGEHPDIDPIDTDLFLDKDY